MALYSHSTEVSSLAKPKVVQNTEVLIQEHPPLLGLEYSRASTKELEAEIAKRKSLVQVSSFIIAVFYWQEEREVLLEVDKNLNTMVSLIAEELLEVHEERVKKDSSDYSFRKELGESMDVGFLLSASARLLQDLGEEVDVYRIMTSARGQASNNPNVLVEMNEVVRNTSDKMLKADLEQMWILWISYLINMEYAVDPNRELVRYTIPKNNGNYVKELLNTNPLFAKAHKNKPMDQGEKVMYFSHYRKAVEIIRGFIERYVDLSIEDTGLRPEHYRPYEMLIYNFKYFRGTGIGPEEALSMLREQLFDDYRNEVEAAGGRQEKILIAGQEAVVVKTRRQN